LITAFRATLEEMEGSDILIHLVDASSAQLDSHIASVVKILEELSLSEIPRVLVFNKADLLNPDELDNMKRAYGAIAISALQRATLLPMIERVGELLDQAMAQREKKTEAEPVAHVH